MKKNNCKNPLLLAIIKNNIEKEMENRKKVIK